jgi:hypothetical protein
MTDDMELVIEMAKIANTICKQRNDKAFGAFSLVTVNYFRLKAHFEDVEKRYIRPDKDATAVDNERDKALVTQRLELAKLLAAFDDALTSFEKQQPIPDEYDNTEKE